MTTDYIDPDTQITWVGEHDRELTQEEMRIAAKLFSAFFEQNNIPISSKRVTFNARGFGESPLEMP
jgi:hypothetical protein